MESNPPLKKSSFEFLQGAGLVLALWFVLAGISFYGLVMSFGNQFDFYPRWVGANQVLQGHSPYSDEVTAQIQVGMFGHLRESGVDQQRFAYVAWITWLLLPFWLVPFPLAISVWLGLQLLALLGLPVWAASILKWRIPPLALVLILCFSIFGFRYPLISYLLGQFTPFLLACLVSAWWGFANKNPIVIAVSLILALVHPEVMLLPLAALLLFTLQLGYRNVLIVWGAAIVGLWLVTRLVIGAWELDFYQGVLAYRDYAVQIWAPGLLPNTWLAILVCGLVVAWSGWMLLQVRTQPTAEKIGWVLAVSVLANLVLLPQTGTYALLFALCAVWMAFWAYREKIWYWLPLLAILVTPWFFDFAGGDITVWERLVIPLALGIVLTHSWLFHKTATLAQGALAFESVN